MNTFQWCLEELKKLDANYKIDTRMAWRYAGVVEFGLKKIGLLKNQQPFDYKVFSDKFLWFNIQRRETYPAMILRLGFENKHLLYKL
jgi:hypothetical protein